MRRGMRGRPMPRRAGRPGLLGTAARTAVVAGTATAVVGGVHRHQEQKTADQQAADAQQQQLADQQQQPAQQSAAQQTATQQAAPQQAVPQQAVPQQPSPPAGEDRLAKIKELGQMRDQGLLTDQEFASEKARLLATLESAGPPGAGRPAPQRTVAKRSDAARSNAAPAGAARSNAARNRRELRVLPGMPECSRAATA